MDRRNDCDHLAVPEEKEGRTTVYLSDVLSRKSTIEKQILSVAVPNIVENGLFQVAKVVLASVIATFGTVQLAANGIGQTLWNLLLTLSLPLYLRFYSASPEVIELVVLTTIIHNIFTAFVSPLAQSLPCGFKAAGDVRYPMITAVICTCGIRVLFTFLLGVWLKMGLMGYMWAMCIDWSVKAVLMVIHAVRGTWKNKRIIDA